MGDWTAGKVGESENEINIKKRGGRLQYLKLGLIYYLVFEFDIFLMSYLCFFVLI